MDRISNALIGTFGTVGSISFGESLIGMVAGLATIVFMVVATTNEVAKRKNRRK